jgi:hypothetical protein
MNWPASIANSLWLASSLAEWNRFRNALRRPEQTQLALLKKMLQSNLACEFGRRHEFSSIKSCADFQSRIPVSEYEDIRPWVDRIRAGEPGVLASETVTHLVPTSGTTTARKLIPFTNSLQRDFNRTIAPWIVDLARQRPQILAGPAYWSISPSLRLPREQSKIPIGFDDDVSYLGGAKAWLVRKAVVTPDVRGKEFADFQTETIRALTKRRDLRLISVWHPSFLTILLDKLPCGTDPMEVWPDLQVISCWGDAAAEAGASEIAERFPGVLLQRKGLLATEAFVTVPFQNAFPLAIRSHFFEFLDSTGRIRLAHELALGEKYEVIVTTSGGLWRYKLRDIIGVTGFAGETPSLRFLGRANTSDLCGEKLAEEFVAACVGRVFGHPRFALLAPNSGRNRYNFFFEGAASPEALDRFENALRENPHYAHCRNLGQLQPIRCIQITANAFETFLRVQTQNGACAGSVKPTFLSTKSNWETVFRSVADMD